MKQFDFSLVRSCRIHLRTILQRVPQLLYHIMILNIAHSRLMPDITGDIAFSLLWTPQRYWLVVGSRVSILILGPGQCCLINIPEDYSQNSWWLSQLYDYINLQFYHDVNEICWPQPIRSLKLGHVSGQGYRNWYQYWGHCCLINDLVSSPQPEGEARGLWWASQVVNETTMTEIEVSISILSWWNQINDE